MHVLIIEDNRDAASGLSGFLESKGHVVESAGSGISSLQLALIVQYDAIIILDAMRHGMDGRTLCRKLREEGCTVTPILMLSEHDSPDEKIACIEAGADDYLVKHATMSEIESRLRVLFRMKSCLKANANFC